MVKMIEAETETVEPEPVIAACDAPEPQPDRPAPRKGLWAARIVNSLFGLLAGCLVGSGWSVAVRDE